MMMVDDETLLMYVEEAMDHLADIENDLLSIEQNGADIDEDLVNKVFRAAHSIKGGAGFMGLNQIKELSHRLENILGMIRSREMVPTSDIVSRLLRGFDRLRDMVSDAHNSEGMDIAAEVEALQSIGQETAAPAVASAPQEFEIRDRKGNAVFRVPPKELDEAARGGKFLYLLEFDLLHDISPGRTPLDLVRDVADGGAIVDCKIDLAAVGTLADEIVPVLPLYALHATVIDWDFISSVYGLPDERILRVDYAPGSGKPPMVLTRQETQARTAPPPPPPPPTPAPSAPPPELELPPTTLYEQPAAEPVAAVSAPQVPKSAPPPRAAESAADAGKAAMADTSLRVHVSLLDNLMTLAGELVLGRNQLVQAKASRDMHALDAVTQRIDLITSELQETIMLTRMQPIGNIFNKFPRVVRDLAQKLSKEVDLKLEGREVELDKTIIEGLNDPLTHLVRNSVDHGIESPAERKAAGKPAIGTVQLIAYHEAGQVNIEIVDDGRGIDPEKLAQVAVRKGLVTEEHVRLMTDEEKTALILLPGFSTAEKVTDVSGRGVGMDVVKTNLDKLGGLIQIDSKVGRGTTIRIKLPLTLAIIPTQIVLSGGQRFAIPQVNMDELLRIPASQVKNRIEVVGDAEVVRLRGKLLPLVVLSDVLDIDKSFIDPETGERAPDRRRRVADRRGKVSAAVLPGEGGGQEAQGEGVTPTRTRQDRRYRAASAVNIVVVTTGTLKYGLVVDELNDAEEIVVKPLGRHLKRTKGYAGATIMGDGQVSLIIDVSGIAHMAQLGSVEKTERALEVAREAGKHTEGLQSLVLFHNEPDEQFAVPVELVLRIEKVRAEKIEAIGGQRTMQYRGGTLPLFTISQVASVKPLPQISDYVILVFSLASREIGLLCCGPVDAVDYEITVDTETFRQTGVSGSTIIDGVTTLMVDIYGVVETLHPDWFVKRAAVEKKTGDVVRILFAEDSDFFRSQIAHFLQEGGYEVSSVVDGLDAWNHLEANPGQVDMLVTDIEMPRMDGFELVRKIRLDARYARLPIVAVTTRASDEDVRTGTELGIDEYQIKLDKERLMEAVHRAARKAAGH